MFIVNDVCPLDFQKIFLTLPSICVAHMCGKVNVSYRQSRSLHLQDLLMPTMRGRTVVSTARVVFLYQVGAMGDGLGTESMNGAK